MSFLAELKRRNVIRVAAAYVVVGWLLLQAADVLSPALHLPEWIVTAIALLLLLGFVPVLLFSWVYELTPEGLKKDADVDVAVSTTSETGRKLNIITIIAVVGIAALIGWQQLGPPPAPQANSIADAPPDSLEPASPVAANTVDDASIAVLPFADLSPGNDQAYFSDGIAEEILNVLVRIESLTVASRTSAFGFKGQEALGIPTIAARLKVRHILEGSVRKSGDTVRITAQLIDAQTDAHLWSQTFDRELTTENIFAVQDEIAGAIVTQLGLVLGDAGVGASPVKVTTESVDAYEIYLKAQGLFHVRDEQNIPEIVELYEQAVALDPDFAEAWAGLAAAYLVVPGWALGSREDYYPKAIEAADRATTLDDRLALPYAVRGSTRENDFIGALAQLDRAVQLDPSSIQSIYFRAAIWLDLGYLERAEAGFRRCLELDSAYAICSRFLSFALLYQGYTKQAIDLFKAGVIEGQRSYTQVFASYFGATGDTLALAWLVADSFPQDIWLRKLFYRFQTDMSYSLDALNADLRSGAASNLNTGEALDEVTIEGFESGHLADDLWNQYDPFLRRPELRDEYLLARKRKILETGVLAYWKAHGFPAQCRALGSDDFDCDW